LQVVHQLGAGAPERRVDPQHPLQKIALVEIIRRPRIAFQPLLPWSQWRLRKRHKPSPVRRPESWRRPCNVGCRVSGSF
jgi:hypothetical protein